MENSHEIVPLTVLCYEYLMKWCPIFGLKKCELTLSGWAEGRDGRWRRSSTSLCKRPQHRLPMSPPQRPQRLQPPTLQRKAFGLVVVPLEIF